MKASAATLAFVATVLLARDCSGEKLALILLDGFSWDYVDQIDESRIPTLFNLLNAGVRAEYVQSIYPSISFPAWTTIVTGLSAERHGIVGNYIWNPETGLEFALDRVNGEGDTTADPSWWTDHTPLWITSTNAGIKTSLYIWSRCDVAFGGVLPEKCTSYDNDLCLDIDLFESNLLEAADDLAGDVGLSMVYYSNVDELGHRCGPYSDCIYDEISEVDFRLELFLERLTDNGIRDDVNIIIVSDHGMISSFGQVKTRVTKFVDGDLIEKAVDTGAFMHLALKDKSLVPQVVEDLQEWERCHAYAKDDIPDHFNFKDHEFILDILIDCDADGKVDNDGYFPEAFLPDTGLPDDVMVHVETGGGNHGYDDTSPVDGEYEEGNVPEMRGIFFASGPKFKSGGLVTDWIKLVDEYQVFLEVLGIEGEEHEGTFSRVEDMFV